MKSTEASERNKKLSFVNFEGYFQGSTGLFSGENQPRVVQGKSVPRVRLERVPPDNLGTLPALCLEKFRKIPLQLSYPP